VFAHKLSEEYHIYSLNVRFIYISNLIHIECYCQLSNKAFLVKQAQNRTDFSDHSDIDIFANTGGQ